MSEYLLTEIQISTVKSTNWCRTKTIIIILTKFPCCFFKCYNTKLLVGLIHLACKDAWIPYTPHNYTPQRCEHCKSWCEHCYQGILLPPRFVICIWMNEHLKCGEMLLRVSWSGIYYSLEYCSYLPSWDKCVCMYK